MKRELPDPTWQLALYSVDLQFRTLGALRGLYIANFIAFAALMGVMRGAGESESDSISAFSTR